MSLLCPIKPLKGIQLTDIVVQKTELFITLRCVGNIVWLNGKGLEIPLEQDWEGNFTNNDPWLSNLWKSMLDGPNSDAAFLNPASSFTIRETRFTTAGKFAFLTGRSDFTFSNSADDFTAPTE
jgi:hypothetical protein